MGYDLMPEPKESATMNGEFTDKPHGRNVFIRSRTPLSEVLAQLKVLESQGWFSPLTNKVEIMFTTYNAHKGVLTAHFVLFFFNGAGHIGKRVEPISVWLDPYHNTWWVYVIDCVWLLLVTKIFLEEAFDIIKHIKQLGFSVGLRTYLTVYNAVDWCNILISIVIVVVWTLHLRNVQILDEMMRNADVHVPGSWTSDQEVLDFFEKVQETVVFFYDVRILVALYQFFIAFRFFKAFDAQPRLSLVTRTISNAMVSIIHFGVVFFTIFFIFVVAAICLFGQEDEYFAHVGRASHTTFRVVLGDFDWGELHQVGRIQALIWFWAVTWVLNLTMLNMFLGIILDTYSCVKDEVMSQPGIETLWSQAFEICIRRKKIYFGDWLSLHFIMKTLDPTDLNSDDEDTCDPLLTIDAFMAKVPNLHEEQAEDILVTAFVYYHKKDVAEEPVEDVAIRRLDDICLTLSNKIDDVKCMAGRAAIQPDRPKTEVGTQTDGNFTVNL